MSENAPDPQDPQGGAGAPDPTPGPQNPADDADPRYAALNREAASRRHQLREAEAERDALRGQLDARDRQDAERISGTSDQPYQRRMIRPDDLWQVGGVELSDLRDEDGLLDAGRVRDAVTRIANERPYLTEMDDVPFDGGAGQDLPRKGPSIGEAIKRARRSA